MSLFRPLILWLGLLLPGAAMADGWALDGYDPVAYLATGQAVAGRAEISTEWRGQSWHFASEQNRVAFEANPRAYAPGFRGLCVVALSEGERKPGDPRQFVLIGGRVYFTRSAEAREELLDDPRDILMSAKAAYARLAQ